MESLSLAKKEKYYQLSENQKNIWQISAGKICTFFSSIELELNDKYSVQEFLQVIPEVLKNHEILSYKLHLDERYNYPLQYFPQNALNNINYKVISKNEKNYKNLVDEYLNSSFDSFTDTPLRFCFVTYQNEVCRLYIKLYTFWGDSYSLHFFTNELFKNLKTNNHNVSDRLPYIKFCIWQNDLISEEDEEALFFWNNYKYNTSQKFFAFSKNENDTKSNYKKYHLFNIDKKENELFKYYDNKLEEKVLFQFIKYLFQFVDDEVTIGYRSSVRIYQELSDTLGLVNKIIPLNFNKIDIDQDELKAVNNEISKVQSWGDFFSSNKNFDLVFEYLDVPQSSSYKINEFRSFQEEFKIKLQILDKGDEASFNLFINEKYFSSESAKIIAGQLHSFLKYPQSKAKLSDIDQKAYANLNKTQISFSNSYQSIIELIEEQTKKYPDNIAIEFKGRKISYGELKSKSDYICKYLIGEIQIKRNQPVGVFLERSDLFIASILGVLKAGACYIPIDANQPEVRLKYILENSNCKCLITNFDMSDDLSIDNLHIINPESQHIYEQEKDTLIYPLKIDNNAYYIYTSGSTGKPKGCKITHKNLLNYIQWANQYYFENNLVGNWGFFTSISFDLSVTAIFCSLTRGKTLWIGDESMEISDLIKSAFNNSEIDTIKLTPSHISLLKELGLTKTNLKNVIIGGERLNRKHISIINSINQNINIFNEYGPTECTVGCVVKKVTSDSLDPITIGTPVANTSIYILNENKELCPIGMIGELYIGGESLFEGYVNNTQLTENKKCILSINGEDIELYSSGDMARVLPSGEIEYVGREDDQVKINGYRIEVDEIKHHLDLIEGVNNSVIVNYELSEDSTRLVAFYVSDKNINDDHFRSSLSNFLPTYMLPSYFYQVDNIPLTVNGKVDKNILPKIEEILSRKKKYVAPTTLQEKQIVEIWESELLQKGIGIQDDFISLGGDSIRAIRILSKMNKLLTANFQIADIYKYLTIQKLLGILETRLKVDTISAEKNTLKNNFKATFYELGLNKDIIDAYPMSDIEVGMVYSGALLQNQGVYHDQVGYPVSIENFNEETFVKAVDLMIVKHDILRTAYNFSFNRTPLRLIYQSLPANVTFTDLVSMTQKEQETEIEEFMIKERENSTFDINKPGLWKIDMFILGDNKQYLLFQFHHAILDGWSRASLMTELNNTYFEMLKNKNFKPQNLGITYKDYVIDQETIRNNIETKKYWESTLQSYNKLQIFEEKDEIEDYLFDFEGESFKQLENYCQRYKISIQALNFAAYLYSLKMMSYDNDILIGLVANGRPIAKGGDELLGCFLNTVPFRKRIDEDTINDFVLNVSEQLNQLKQHEKYSLLTLQKDFSDDGTQNPFFDTLFNYVDFHIYKNAIGNQNENLDDKDLKHMYFENTNTFLNVHVALTNSGFQIVWNRTKKLKSNKTNKDLCEYHTKFLKQVIENPTEKLIPFKFIPDAEKQLINSFNSYEMKSLERSILHLFNDQVKKLPNKTAIKYNGKKISFKELDVLSNQLSNYLVKKYNIEKNDFVVLQLPRSEWMLITIVASFKIGAVYIPLDENITDQRLQYVREDCNYKLSINNNVINDFVEHKENYTKDYKYDYDINARLAYTIYTSGTTGRPKGVKVKHLSLLNRLLWMKEDLSIIKEDNILQKTPYTFDVSLWELMMPLITGSTLVFAVPQGHKDPIYIQDTIKKESINLIHFVPSMLSPFLGVADPDKCKSIKHLVCSGEALSADLVKKFKNDFSFANIHNYYGPTEAAIEVTAINLSKSNKDEDIISIGYPVTNTQIHIVNKDLQLQPFGIEGELLISGIQVAEGYLNNVELTNEKFVAPKFMPELKKVYRTGDLAKWLPDGSIEYIGRIDNQLKIRGFRIEPKEIESAVRLFSNSIENVVVIAKKVNNNTAIITYYLSEKEIDKEEIKSFLKNYLPDYMIPTYYVKISKIPLSPSGKIDFRSLPEVTEDNSLRRNYIAPGNALEEHIHSIWSGLLIIDKISVVDNFFEIGGTSISLVQMFERFQNEGYAYIKITDLFNNPTIQSQAQLISKAKGEKTELAEINEIDF